ncbi:hypothetical protein F5884DRAFT_265968 [Xylogone sp. PMI_703]|nr:hypothetical protein F5884DRAFT_265968 [Xylogone sp. PMI_703]
MEAVLRMVSGLAPNLKDVRIFRIGACNSPEYIRAWKNGVRRPWPGFSHEHQKNKTRGAKLERLELHKAISPERLSSWNDHTDFSFLRVLKLEGTLNPDALHWAATNCTFLSLTTLVLNMDYYHQWPHRPDVRVRHQIAIEAFLRNLPPLKNLRLEGGIWSGALEGHY